MLDIKSIKEEFLNNNNNEMIYVERWDTRGYNEEPKKIFAGVLPKRIIDLSEKYNGIVFFPGDFSVYTGPGDIYHFSQEVRKFSYEECSEEQKKMIEEKKAQLEEISSKIEQDKMGKYDRKGRIKIPCYDEDWPRENGAIELVVTERELVEAGYIPEDFGWEPIVKPKDIATTSIEEKVQKEEEKSIWEIMCDKIKNILNGRESV